MELKLTERMCNPNLLVPNRMGEEVIMPIIDNDHLKNNPIDARTCKITHKDNPLNIMMNLIGLLFSQVTLHQEPGKHEFEKLHVKDDSMPEDQLALLKERATKRMMERCGVVLYMVKYKNDEVERHAERPKDDGKVLPRHLIAELTLCQLMLFKMDGVQRFRYFMNRTDYPFDQDNTNQKVPDIHLEEFYGAHVLAVINTVNQKVVTRNQKKKDIKSWTNNSAYLQVLLKMHMLSDIIETLTYYGPNPKYDRSKNPLFDRFIDLNICYNNIDTTAGIIL